MPRSNLILHLAEMPPGGLSLQGEMDRAVFDLRDSLAKPLSELGYQLHASLAEGFLILKGRLEAEFELICARTTDPFPYLVELDPYLETIEVENGDSIDLTDQLREDILLALPAYPRAPGSEETADWPGMTPDDHRRDSESRRSEWDALDGLKTKD